MDVLTVVSHEMRQPVREFRPGRPVSPNPTAHGLQVRNGIKCLGSSFAYPDRGCGRGHHACGCNFCQRNLQFSQSSNMSIPMMHDVLQFGGSSCLEGHNNFIVHSVT